jgi:hypothetical protein
MMKDAFSDIVMAFNRYQVAIETLEAEVATLKEAVKINNLRLVELEQGGHNDTDLAERIEQVLETNTFDDLLERKVDDAISSYDFSDAIDTAMSGREVTITL